MNAREPFSAAGLVLLLLVVLLALMGVHSIARADPIMRAKIGEVLIILHSEPCKLDAVTNLKRRATWQEGGAIVEGCWGVMAQVGIVYFYFADRTVTGLPVPLFEPVSGA